MSDLSQLPGPATALTRRRDPFRGARLCLVAVLAALVGTQVGLGPLLAEAWLPLIGLAGALVANATGIGGGVVFVPAFHHLGLPESQIVGTSLLIQSFGMTMGALTYLARRPRRGGGLDGASYARMVMLALVPSVLGALCVTKLGLRPDLPLATIYKTISLMLVGLIVAASLCRYRGDGVFRPGLDAPVLLGLGFAGGLFIGWISIGVGELVGVYLLLRGFRMAEAIGMAVVVTALSVLSVQAVHFPGLPADVPTGLMVAIGALLGGYLAPRVLDLVGQARVKWFCAFWIVVSVIAT